jgi:hypothetical protein
MLGVNGARDIDDSSEVPAAGESPKPPMDFVLAFFGCAFDVDAIRIRASEGTLSLTMRLDCLAIVDERCKFSPTVRGRLPTKALCWPNCRW